MAAVDPLYSFYSTPHTGGGTKPPIPVYQGAGVVSSLARNIALPVFKNTARDLLQRGLTELQQQQQHGSGVKTISRRKKKNTEVPSRGVKKRRRRANKKRSRTVQRQQKSTKRKTKKKKKKRNSLFDI